MTNKEIQKRVAVCDYLTVAQIFLQDNFLLERALVGEDVKPRLLGHWGTCHGINLLYANACELPGFQFILGPGHGFPALQANLWLDGELLKIDPKATLDAEGIKYICRNFSWPEGFPSHSSPMTPGVITEGGELGYALATAYGAALGRPGKTIVVMVGDGELETATALASLNLPKLRGGKNDGKILPVLHLNGYKISGPTVYGRKSERELMEMLRGFGYQPIVIRSEKTEDIQEALGEALKLEQPFLVLKTAKGETGPETLDGYKIAGNYLAHQVPLPKARSDENQLKTLEEWLKSYEFEQNLKDVKRFSIGAMNSLAVEKPVENSVSGLVEKSVEKFQIEIQKTANKDWVERVERPGTETFSPARAIGGKLRAAMEQNSDFYLFSPDETTSNKLDEVYKVMKRAWRMPTEEFDLPAGEDGRIVELLSENTLFSCMLGHLMAGGEAMMTSYEAFFSVITSQILQQIKFIVQSEETSWRKPLGPVNLLSTSTCWRQDHNGYSHQSPALISTLLAVPSGAVNCIFPIDDVAARASFDFMQKSRNVVNLTTFNKTDEPRWIDSGHAKFQFENGGASIFGFASDEDFDWRAKQGRGVYVLTAAGDIVSREALFAIKILREDLPDIKLRFVGINSLTYGAIGTKEKKLSPEIFESYFSKTAPIIANFHGYPETLKTILVGYTNGARILAHGFKEKGSTTTPFEMLSLNEASRYHLCIDVARMEGREDLVQKYQQKIAKNREYARENGVDTPEIANFSY